MQVKIFSHYMHLPFVVLAMCEGVALWLAALFSLLYLHVGAPHSALVPLATGIAILTLIAMSAFGMFSRRFRERAAGEVLRIALAALVGGIAAAVWDPP